jgi:hypothetical protein
LETIVILPAEITDALAPGVKRIEREGFLSDHRGIVRVGRAHHRFARSALSHLSI